MVYKWFQDGVIYAFQGAWRCVCKQTCIKIVHFRVLGDVCSIRM